jgi:uncharacterized protein YbaR (Trm112 family)
MNILKCPNCGKDSLALFKSKYGASLVCSICRFWMPTEDEESDE